MPRLFTQTFSGREDTMSTPSGLVTSHGAERAS
nr:MAG TPA: hypothetical protein [Caudoviricetes sp.]